MQFSSPVVLIIILALVIFYASYETHKLKTKIRCIFIRADNTIREKWINAHQRRVEFDDGWYHVLPDRALLTLLDKGIFALFPTKAESLIFTSGSDMPMNAKTFNTGWGTPEARKALSKEEDILALRRSQQQLGSKQKRTLFEGWMPIITIGGFLILGYLQYTQNNKADMIGQAVNVLQQMMMK